MQSDLLKQVEAVIREKKLFRDGQKILVAVSGGVDSMVLLRLLHDLTAGHHWQLVVAHFNHQLRGKAAEADEQLVRETADSLGWPIMVGSASVEEHARVRNWSVEMAGRELRHQFFAQAAGKHHLSCVALAHHADDQVETFFLRLLRGAGSRGLAGMRWSAPSPADPSLALVRPLLDRPKSDLVEFARAQKILFAEDATNASLDILRNRVRHELLPLLREKYQPAVDRCVLRLMELSRDEDDLVRECAEEWRKGHLRRPFGRLPVAVQRHLLQQQLLGVGQPVDFDLVETLRTKRNRTVMGASGQLLHLSDYGDLSMVTLEKTSFDAASLLLNLSGPSGNAKFGPVNFSWRKSDHKKMNRTRRAGREQFDAVKVGDEICLRHWQPGDRFHLIGAPGPAKLQDIFTNLKVPQPERHRRVVAATSRGEIFWVEGLRIGEGFKLDKSTIRCLNWRWKRNKSRVAA